MRDKGASVRALQLLSETSGADVQSTLRPTPTLMDQYRSENRIPQRETVPRFVNCEQQENWAESSRPKRALTAEDVRDPETVAGMKGQMDIEREERAKKKALFLMRFGCFA